jgi:hypothetical protein
MTMEQFLQRLQSDPEFYALFVQFIKDISYEGYLERMAGAALADITASDFAEIFMRELQGEQKTPQDIFRLFLEFMDRRLQGMEDAAAADTAAWQQGDADTLQAANDYTDNAIAAQLLGVQTWLPAVQTLADLPASVPAANTNYLCRVINDPTAANEGVYQHIASATTAAAWTFFSDNKDWIDEQELSAALPAVIVAATEPTTSMIPALKDGDIWIQYP